VAGDELAELLWWVAAALAMRCVFESVMVAYYIWPVLAVALIAAAETWSRLIPTAVVAGVLTFVSQSPWRDPWGWWALVVGGLALVLYCARPAAISAPALDATALLSRGSVEVSPDRSYSGRMG
jgi:hypothetical protein